MKQELLPCPFCGNEPAISNYAKNWYGCPNANCPASVVNTSVATWNTRAPDARVQLLAKALQEARVEVLYWFENADPAIPLQDRAPAGWVRVVDKIDAALAEAGIQDAKA